MTLWPLTTLGSEGRKRQDHKKWNAEKSKVGTLRGENSPELQEFKGQISAWFTPRAGGRCCALIIIISRWEFPGFHRLLPIPALGSVIPARQSVLAGGNFRANPSQTFQRVTQTLLWVPCNTHSTLCWLQTAAPPCQGLGFMEWEEFSRPKKKK